MAFWEIFKAKSTPPPKKNYTFGSPRLSEGSYLSQFQHGNKMVELETWWKLYSNHHWINTCLNKIAQAGSKSYELVPIDPTKPSDVQDEETEIIYAFLNSPNPDESFHEVLFKMHRDVMTFGVCFAELQCSDSSEELVRPIIEKALSPMAEYISDVQQQAEDIIGEVVQSGIPAYLRVLPAQQMEVVNDDDGNITSYVQWKANGKKAYFTPDEIVHILHPHAQDPRYGESPLKAIATVATTDILIDRRQKRMIENQLCMDIVVKMPGAAEEEGKRFYEQVNSNYKAQSSNTNIIVTTNDITFENFATSKDGDYLKQADDNMKTICMSLGVPLSVIGVVDGTAGKGSGADSHLRTFIEHTVRTITMKIQNTLNRQVFSRFQAVGWDYTLRIVLEDTEDKTDVINNQINAVHAGLMTVNEARSALSMSPLPNGDDAFIVAGSTVMPLDQVGAIPPAPVMATAPSPEPKAVDDAKAQLKKAISTMRKAMDADA